MSPTDSKATLRLGLRRMTLEDRIFGDPELRACPLVRLWGEDALRVALTGVSGRRHPDGGRLFLEHDAGDSLFLLVKGEVRLIVAAEGAADGAAVLEVGAARKGEVLGESEALGGEACRAFSAQAVGELEVLEFPSPLLRRSAPEGSSLHAYLLQVAAGRKAARDEACDFFSRW